MVIVPFEELSAPALRGLLESIVTREGTDYGDEELSFETKVGHLYEEVIAKRSYIVFDSISETSTVLTKEQYAEFRYMQDAANQEF